MEYATGNCEININIQPFWKEQMRLIKGCVIALKAPYNWTFWRAKWTEPFAPNMEKAINTLGHINWETVLRPKLEYKLTHLNVSNLLEQTDVHLTFFTINNVVF